MQFTLLNGMHPGQTQLEKILEIAESLLSGSGHTARTFNLHEYDIPWCRGDFHCWIRTPGECLLKGISSEIGNSLVNSQAAVFLTPVTFGGYSSHLKKALDHQIGLILPHFTQIGGETHHKPRYEQYPRIAGIGFLGQPDAEQEQIFARLIERNAVNLHAPAHAASFIYGPDSPDRVRVKLSL